MGRSLPRPNTALISLSSYLFFLLNKTDDLKEVTPMQSSISQRSPIPSPSLILTAVSSVTVMVTTASAHLAQPSSWLTTCSALMFSFGQERCIITSRVYYPCSAYRSHGTSLENANCFQEHKNAFTQQHKGQSYTHWGINVYRQGGGARKQLFLHKSRSHVFPGTDWLQGSKEQHAPRGDLVTTRRTALHVPCTEAFWFALCYCF